MTNSEEDKQVGWHERGKLAQLAEELERQRKSKCDFIADTRSVRIVSDGGRLKLCPAKATDPIVEWLSRGGVPIQPAALQQIGDKAEPNVPSRFLGEMAKQRPQRLAALLSGLLEDEPKRRFIRMLDGNVRAFLSDRYRVLDHHDIAFAALDAVRAVGGEVIEASLSETHMRLKFTTRKLAAVIDQAWLKGKSIRAGDLANPEYLKGIDFQGGAPTLGTSHPVVVVGNSETGHGGFFVDVGLFDFACANTRITDNTIGKIHLGERLELGLFSDATLHQEAKAIYMKARDVVKNAFDPVVFEKLIALAKKANELPIKAPTAAVENVAKEAGISDQAKDILLGYFVKDYQQTVYGLSQAVSRLAQDESSDSGAANLESVAGKLMTGALKIVA